jgi:DNA mismatch repair protein MutL
VGFISQNLLLLKLEHKFYVADLKKLMGLYLLNSINEFQINEENTGPLLISEPFKISRGKIDSHLEELKTLGFELDRLNNEMLALRTLPRFVPQALSREMTNCFIKYFEMPKIKHFSPKEFADFVGENWPSINSIPDHLLLMIISKTAIVNSLNLLELSEKNLKGLL